MRGDRGGHVVHDAASTPKMPTDADISDYVKSEADLVGRDLGELRSIVTKVEPRLRAVIDAMMTKQRKDGRPRLVARNSFFRNLRAIYEHHTDQKATATVDHVDPGDLGAGSQFIDFVVAVNRETRASLPDAGLGNQVKNFLYPPKNRKRV